MPANGSRSGLGGAGKLVSDDITDDRVWDSIVLEAAQLVCRFGLCSQSLDCARLGVRDLLLESIEFDGDILRAGVGQMVAFVTVQFRANLAHFRYQQVDVLVGALPWAAPPLVIVLDGLDGKASIAAISLVAWIRIN